MKLSVLLVTAMALSACGIQDGATGMQDGGAASLRLQQGMTEDEAINAIGIPPSKAEMKACGTATKDGGWSCKILYFDTIPNLIVFETNVKGTWAVNSWITN